MHLRKNVRASMYAVCNYGYIYALFPLVLLVKITNSKWFILIQNCVYLFFDVSITCWLTII